KWPYWTFYLACGYVAAYGFAAMNPGSLAPLVGASGAIAGVLGAYIVLFPRARVWSLVPFLFFIPLRIPAWFVLGLWFVLQGVYSLSPATGGAVAYLAHVFGFLAGVLVGLVVRAAGPRQPTPPRPRYGWSRAVRRHIRPRRRRHRGPGVAGGDAAHRGRAGPGARTGRAGSGRHGRGGDRGRDRGHHRCGRPRPAGRSHRQPGAGAG